MSGERGSDGAAGTDRYDRQVAIVGMAGRFPGARDLEELWRNLREGVEAVRSFADDELLAAGADPALLRDPQYVKAGSVLEGADLFDAPFFGLSAREAELLDPQQRLFLEQVWHALEDAGRAGPERGGLVGLYAGVGWNTYLLSNLASRPELFAGAGGFQVFITNDKDFMPTRVSYKLDLKGPSVVVQTSCSTSLVAVHLACLSLLAYECDLALAGGVTVKVPQVAGYHHEPGGLASPDGHCRAFDARAAGTVFGSGVGVVALKRLADALADGDRVRAVIRGSAINNDGSAKVSYTAPSVEGQAEVIAAAQAVAGISPDTVRYVETHGTGTALGDPIEVAALTRVFREGTDRRGFCGLGSIKTNLGHLDAAAGVAGLIKTVLALEHRELPPSLHYEEPNPEIDFAATPFYVQRALEPWERGEAPRRAGVSSFGVGGTNAHVILEEAPERPAPVPSRPWQLLVLSARSEAALGKAVARLAAWLREPVGAATELADVAHTLQVGRAAFRHRAVAVCRDREDALAVLAGAEPGRLATGLAEDEPWEEPVAEGPATGAEDEGARRRRLESLGRRWLVGARVDWAAVRGGEERRRVRLPLYPFEGRRYWIEAAGPAPAAAPGAPAKRPDPADWFYLPSWRRTLSPPPAQVVAGEDDGGWLVLRRAAAEGSAGAAFGRLLVERLRTAGRRVTEVQPGPGFRALDAGAFALDPARPEDWRALAAALGDGGPPPRHLVHAWLLGGPEAAEEGDAAAATDAFEAVQRRGFYALLHLLRALGPGPGAGGAPDLTVVADRLAAVTGEEPLDPARAPLVGLCRVLPQERPGAAARALDLVLPPAPAPGGRPGARLADPADPAALAALVDRVIAEVATGAPAGAPAAGAEPVVALRHGERWVPAFEPVRLAGGGPSPFRTGGVYLVTGGLSGNGLALARYLAREHGARLALLAGPAPPDGAPAARAAEIEALGGEVLTLNLGPGAGWGDEAAWDRALGRIAERFGGLHGVIHAAGASGERAFRTLAEVGEAECAWHFGPKVHALFALDRALDRAVAELFGGREPDVRVLLSSLAAVVGGVAYGPYAAANRVLDAFAARGGRRRSGASWLSLDWDLWRHESAEERITSVRAELAELEMSPREGEEAWCRALARGRDPGLGGRLVVSTADLPRRIAHQEERVSELGGRPRAAAVRHPRPALAVPYAPPEGDLEARIAAVWGRILGFEEVGALDNFFDLGGDSFVAIQVASELRDELGVELPAAKLYQGLTVRSLARLLAADGSGPAAGRAEELAERRAAMDRRRRFQEERRSRQRLTEAVDD